MSPSIRTLTLIILVIIGACSPPRESAHQRLASSILDTCKIKGGLVVHIGCGDGQLTMALLRSDSYRVQGLSEDPESVRLARANIRKMASYGEVSIDVLKGPQLPYVDGLVNLVVSENLGGVPMEEVMRVLAPDGVAYIGDSGDWAKTVKPWPEEIDEWSHYLYDSTNNAVAHDRIVGPPRQLQWIGSPRWSRHHDRMASMSALVSAGGRVFYIFDEGLTASIMAPPKRMLIARDAFNGVILWKRPLPSWHTHLWPYKSGHAQLPRRLVATRDRVFATLGHEARLTELDAATGETIREFEDTGSTEEVLLTDGVLYVLVSDEPLLHSDGEYHSEFECMHEERNFIAETWPWDEKARRLVAIDTDSGQVLWNDKHRIVPLSLAVNERGVFFHDGTRVILLNRENGEPVWKSEPVTRRPTIPTNFGVTLVLWEDVVLFSGGDRAMQALSAETGKVLWRNQHPRSGHHSPEDLLVVNGLVWAGEISAGKDSGVFTGRDPRTGEIKKQFPPDVETYWFHQRCYRSKATDNFFLPSRTGIEFVDFRSEHWDINHWVRGGCIYGVMPSNGLTYAPPHSCSCYIDAKLSGFCALASQSLPRRVTNIPRLEHGPAFGKIEEVDSTSAADWPTYRHDPERSGRTVTSIPAQLELVWEVELGSKLSSVTIADGRLFVASVDEHTVYAVDTESGNRLWSFTAGGRVDSPPTIYKGRVLFGSADGWVYSLRASDGVLSWRFRAAPEDRRLIAFEQVESLWPVHGSVLVQDDMLYCVAGRSMFVDGGMRLLRLNPENGELISETHLDEKDPQTGENLQAHVDGLNMPTALSDILSSDGQFVYMRTQRFGLDGVRQHIAQEEVSEQSGEGAHIFSGVGFLDGTLFHRGYWIYGKSIASGANGWYQAGRIVPAGRLLVRDDSYVYGFGRKPDYYRWRSPQEYQLFSVSQTPEVVRLRSDLEENSRRALEKCQPPTTVLDYQWARDATQLASGMVLSNDLFFVAGPPDMVDEEALFHDPNNPELRRNLDEHVAAQNGLRGAVLSVVSKSDGRPVAELRLESPPVWDGMAAADNSLFLATVDGKVVCLR